MFAKLARLSQFRMLDPGRGAPGRTRLVPANDNARDARPASALRWVRRPVLVCHWWPAPGDGRLECRWHLQDPGEGAVGTPGEGLVR